MFAVTLPVSTGKFHGLSPIGAAFQLDIPVGQVGHAGQRRLSITIIIILIIIHYHYYYYYYCYHYCHITLHYGIVADRRQRRQVGDDPAEVRVRRRPPPGSKWVALLV